MQLKRQLIVADFALTNNTILFTTTDKEAFEGFFKQKKKVGGQFIMKSGQGERLNLLCRCRVPDRETEKAATHSQSGGGHL